MEGRSPSLLEKEVTKTEKREVIMNPEEFNHNLMETKWTQSFYKKITKISINIDKRVRMDKHTHKHTQTRTLTHKRSI